VRGFVGDDVLRVGLITGASVLLSVGFALTLDGVLGRAATRSLLLGVLVLGALLFLAFLFSGGRNRRLVFWAIFAPGTALGLPLLWAANGIAGALSTFFVLAVLFAVYLSGAWAGYATALIAIGVLLVFDLFHPGAKATLLGFWLEGVLLALTAFVTAQFTARESRLIDRLAALNRLSLALHRTESPAELVHTLVEGAKEAAAAAGAAVYEERDGRPRVLAASGDLAEAPARLNALTTSHFPVPQVSDGRFVLALSRPRVYGGWWEDLAPHLALALETAQSRRVTYEELTRAHEALRERAEALEDAYLATAESLVAMLEARDPYTAGHSRRVQSLATWLGSAVGFDDEALEILARAALLHDIGKISLPDGILRKPGPLTEEEWEAMRRHPVTGVEILAGLQPLRPALPIIRSHHERWDGQGYPDGLAGEAIPLGARVLAVADAYDAMTSARSYRAARTPSQALAILREGAGTQWDANLVEVFVTRLPAAEEA
jgi:hypothetical protein